MLPRLEGEGISRKAQESVLYEGREELGAEGNLLEDANDEKRQDGPEKRRAPRPARYEQEPAIDRSVPQRKSDQAVEQYYPVLKEWDSGPGAGWTHSMHEQNHPGR